MERNILSSLAIMPVMQKIHCPIRSCTYTANQRYDLCAHVQRYHVDRTDAEFRCSDCHAGPKASTVWSMYGMPSQCMERMLKNRND
ncbi:hypothetical protein BV898_05767 [Hypsibius exemplaris]|uniref:Uncharacterized protein n=1 Tax=Hypsibius exemplaris TaxID=2072580 RepID=A0A1W0WYD5_HYPEX|nr:hypothetical protein BV898_05767 [Hypsibius exemplaris]